MTDIYLHIDARMSDYIHTHPYVCVCMISMVSFEKEQGSAGRKYK